MRRDEVSKEKKGTEAKELDERTVITENIVLLNPYLFKGKSFNGQPVKYGTGILISKDDDVTIARINHAIEVAIKEGKFMETDKIKLPLRDGDDEYPDRLIYHNSYFLYAVSNIMPSVVGPDMKLNFGARMISHGDYAKACIRFESYNIKDSKGISCELLAVQTLGRKSRLLELRPDINNIFKVEK